MYSTTLRVFGLGLALAACSARADSQVLVLSGAKVLDASGTRFLEGRSVVVREGRISAIVPTHDASIGADAKTLDLTGLWLIPGMIDLHSHLLLRPYDEMNWTDQVLRESLELRTIRAVNAARVTLESGFTTIRDLGTEGAAYADVAIRDAIAGGLIRGPRVFAATRALVATGCYGPAGFDPRWNMPVGAQVADGVAGVRRAVREQISGGADWIKVYADYRRRPGGAVSPTFSVEELRAIVDEAESAGLPVAAHAVTDEAIRRAVLAGADTIEHGTDVSAETLKLMRDRGVVLCPTLAASEAMARYSGWKPGEDDHPRIEDSKKMFRRALDSGVTIACGSDVGVFAHGESSRELRLMVEYGMSSKAALAAATYVAARVLGREDDLGRVAENYIADLVALPLDPFADISATGQAVLVMKDGRMVVDLRR